MADFFSFEIEEREMSWAVQVKNPVIKFPFV